MPLGGWRRLGGGHGDRPPTRRAASFPLAQLAALRTASPPPPLLGLVQLLNAMLLACSGHGSGDALASMRALLGAGAVCDTWAPNGSSALMLAASADCAEGVGLLLDGAASLELQDALGR